MVQHIVEKLVSVVITVADGCDAITRVTGPNGDEWRKQLYNHLHTEDDVLEHWFYNAIYGVTDANRLDGWADLEPGQVTMRVD